LTSREGSPYRRFVTLGDETVDCGLQFGDGTEDVALEPRFLALPASPLIGKKSIFD
jgi:hypothetical protein